MSEDIAILDFDETYRQEEFYRDKSYRWINLDDISGVNGYCEEEAIEAIREKLANTNQYKIKFIGSGNYHYVTYLLLEKIKEPFILVLFDHHTDIMPSRFFNMLSCGCWVKRALDENKNLKKVILIGAKKELIDSIGSNYNNRIISFAEPVSDNRKYWENFSKKYIDYPIYISIDKDVLDYSCASTNWDQGCLTLSQLDHICDTICKNHRVLGMDVCGENSITYNGINTTKEDIRLNDEANKKILEYAEEW